MNHGWVSDLYIRHQAWLLKYLTGRLNNKADAEDICQQLFLRLCEQPQHLTNIHNPRAYLTTLANRMSIDHWRKEEGARKAIDAMVHLPQVEPPSPEQQAADGQALVIIAAQLESIPTQAAAIFIDSRIHALTGKQVAQRHQVSLRTVRNYLSLITQRVRTDDPAIG